MKPDHTLAPDRAQAHMRRETGLSLIELMVSIAIGLILLLGITTVIVRQNAARSELDKASQQIENGRYAIQLLHDDIEHAGFYSYFYNLPVLFAVMPDPCQVTPLMGPSGLEQTMTLPLQGYLTVPTTSACGLYGLVPANYKPGTQILVVRRVDTNGVPSPFTSPTFTNAANAGTVYLQANITSHIMDVSPNTAKFTLTFNTNNNKGIPNIYRYVVHIYFISPCNVPANGAPTCNVAANGTGPDDGGRPIPTLKMLELTGVNGTTTFKMVPLVEGIEDMQFQYGIDNNNDGYPDNNYGTYPASTADWANVMSVAVNVLAQNTECTNGFLDTKSYNLGSGVIAASSIAATVAPCPAGGDYKRHAFSEVVRAVNPSGRRAVQ